MQRGSPDAGAFAAFLHQAARRAHGLMLARGAAVGLAAAALVFGGSVLGQPWVSPGSGLDQAWTRPGPGLGLTPLAITAAFVAFGVLTAWVFFARSAARGVAVTIERRTPASRNLVLTAAEMIGTPGGVAPYIATRVLRDASALVSRVDLRHALPARSTIAGVTAAVALWAVAILVVNGRALNPAPVGPSSTTAAAVLAIDIEVTPPEYTGQLPRTIHNPSRLEVLAGSRLRVMITADATSVTLHRIAGSDPLTRDGQVFSATVLADADGYLSVAPADASGAVGVRSLIGLSVMADRGPNVKITAPGRDMLLADGKHTLPVAIEAEDDLGLATLRLRYTRVAGSGENFTFSDGDVPAAITRTSDRAWAARADWSLAPLALEPGDMIIYRAVATDRRPGAPGAESDSFIVEIAAPGALPGEGFAIDDRQDKYAISQQMVILNTERLLAKRASMPPAEYLREAQGLAAEQRQVRAEFVFMMGGELTDAGLDISTLNEEAEAAGEDDLAAGRLANRGRADLMRAIRSMSRAAARLVEPDVAGALPIEKEALAFLQSAFSRSRYILRTLSERERLDLSRRLTGVLAALARTTRPSAAAPPPTRATEVRRVLVDVATLAAESGLATGDAAARSTALAERVLRIDPAAVPFREVAAALTRAAELITARADTASIHAAFNRASTGLAAIARAELAPDPSRGFDAQLDALAGALADALRREGRSR